jgi:hypothetical protein
MKSIIMAVLLIAAVGTGVYFLFLNKKKNVLAGNEIQKELIIGTWKLDSLSQSKDAPKLIGGLVTIADTNLANYSYQFKQDGKILRLLRDSVQKDTSTYEWTKEQQLVFKQQDDSTGTKFIVSKLNQDSLVLLSKDSSIAYFTRFK